MSHFTVLVIGNDPESALAPYQENNMGDCPKKYLKFHSVEEEYRKEYEEDGVEMIKMDDGRLLYTWDDEIENSIKNKNIIGNLNKVFVKHKDRYSTFENFIKDWAGYKEVDEETGEFGYWENPNAKWDWYQLGGRWKGFFKVKNDNIKDNNWYKEFLTLGFTDGEINYFVNLYRNDENKFYKIVEKYNGKSRYIENYTIKLNNLIYVDQAFKKDIDFDFIINKAGFDAKERYEKVESLFNWKIPKLEYFWKDIVDEKNEKFNSLTVDEKRELYHNQDGMKKLSELRNDKMISEDCKSLVIWMNLEDYQISKEEYIRKAKNNAISTFAVIKDGKWYEKGKMGWWACVSDEKENWNEEFNNIILNLPDDVLLSIYDCHI